MLLPRPPSLPLVRLLLVLVLRVVQLCQASEGVDSSQEDVRCSFDAAGRGCSVLHWELDALAKAVPAPGVLRCGS